MSLRHRLSPRERLSPNLWRFRRTRRRLAREYLHGEGIEIGALHMPLPLPPGVRVRYVDRLDLEGLRRHYPELAGLRLVEPDLVDDGERLARIPDSSQDFVIANHLIEHCQDPLGTLGHLLRVLRPGGMIYLAVPDKRHTIDSARPVTPLAHVERDRDEGPDWSRLDHYEEWERLVGGRSGQDAARRAGELAERDYSIHFHVWTPEAFVELLEHARGPLGMPFEIEAVQPNFHEFIVVLHRTAG